MRRSVIIAAFLLPLPFAALPLASLLVGGPATEPTTELATVTQIPASFDETGDIDARVDPLAYGLAEHDQFGCDSSPSSIEG